jgi:predicted nucleic acid-binding protein
MVNYFFDTYAIIELLLRNPGYKRYEEYPLVTTVLNKIEIYWWALTRYDSKLADIMLSSLSHASEISDEIIRDAMMIRLQYKKKELSYADAIGYAFARKHNLLFLTGDKQFKDLPGVEFVSNLPKPL